MKTCPKCGGNLTAVYREHTKYPVIKIHKDGNIDIDWECGDTYYADLIHIHCASCGAYWYSVDSFLEEGKNDTCSNPA